MPTQETNLEGIVDGTSITVDPITKRLKSTPVNLQAGSNLVPVRFFARPDAAVVPPAGVSIADTHQKMLGHGKEYTLSMFDPVTGQSSATTGVGWSGGDIRVAMQAALDAIEADGCGQLKLPSGILRLSGPLTWFQSGSQNDPNNSGCRIVGHGTLILPDDGNSSALTIGTVAAFTYFIKLAGFQIRAPLGAAGYGHGVVLHGCVYFDLHGVNLRGYYGTHVVGPTTFRGTGLLIDGVSQQGNLTDCILAGNNIGLDYGGGSSAIQIYNCQLEQNLFRGAILRSGAIGIHGGSWQNGNGAGTYDVELAPDTDNSMFVNIQGPIYTEGTLDSNIKASRSPGGFGGTLKVWGLNMAAATVNAIDADGWTLHIGGSTGAGFSSHQLKARNSSLCLTGIGPLDSPSQFDLDAYTIAHMTVVANGRVGAESVETESLSVAVAAHLAAYAPGSEPVSQPLYSMIMNSYSKQPRILTDVATNDWRDLGFAPFEPVSGLGPWLTEVFDARNATHSIGNTDGLVGSFRGLALAPSATKPLYLTEAALNNEPCVKVVSASNSYMDTGTVAAFMLTGATPYIATVYLHPHQAGTATELMYLMRAVVSGDNCNATILEAGASADTINGSCNVGSGGLDTATTATGNGVGHLIETWIDGNYYFAQDGVTIGSVGGAGGGLRPQTALSWSIPTALSTAVQANASIALQVICFTLPPITVRARFKAYVATRFALTIA